MAGVSDPAGTPVLMIYYVGDTSVKLYELPSFACRGVLVPVRMAEGGGLAARLGGGGGRAGSGEEGGGGRGRGGLQLG